MPAVLTGCGGPSNEVRVCNSIHENPVLFDKVLIGGEPAINFPEKTLTPVSLVTSKLGRPDKIVWLENPLFSRWHYGNTVYVVATLAANVPGHEYIAAKICNSKRTQQKMKAILHGNR